MAEAVPTTTTAIAGVFDEGDRRFKSAMKWVTNTGIAAVIVMVLLWYVLLPWMQFFRDEAKLDNDAKRKNDSTLSKALSDNAEAAKTLSTAYDRLQRDHTRSVDILEQQTQLLREIRDDQRRGAWREDPKAHDQAK